MENLAQIESVKQKIKMASATAIKALHKIIFEKEEENGKKGSWK